MRLAAGRCCPCLIAALLPLAGVADAAAAGDGDPAADATALAAVTVTARRRAERLQDVPVAVSAFDAEALDRLDVDDLSDLDAHVPNLTLYAARGSTSTLTAYIRGIGQSDPLWGFDPAVGVYLDDVYIARPQGALLEVFDVARVEVLRGPQGTLYGKNTTGGAVRYPSAPLEAEAYCHATSTVGSHGQRDLAASWNMPFARAGWAGRLALASLHHDGYGDNRLTGQPVSDRQALAARVTLGWLGTPDLRIQLAIDGLDDHSGVRGSQMLAVNPNAPGFAPLPDRYDIRSGMPNINTVRTSGIALTVDRAAHADFELKSVTACRQSDTHSNIDFDTLPARILDARARYSDWQCSQELQALFDRGGMRGVAGLYAFSGAAGGRILGNFFDRLFNSTSGQVDTDSIAAFGDLTWPLTARWWLSAGARLTVERKHAQVFNAAFTDATYTTPNGVVAADFRGRKTFRALSPRLSLEHAYAADTTLYALLTRGYKSGGFNIRANTTAVPASAHPYDDEHVTTFEAGAKLTRYDDRLQLNAALFHNRYRDIQLSVNSAYDSDGDGRDDAFFGDFTNAGRAHAYGAEFEALARVGAGWTLRAQLGWLDARYDAYIDRGIDVADRQRFTNAPEWSGALSLLGSHDFGGATLLSRVTYSAQSTVYPTTDLSPAIRQPGYGLLGASLIWRTQAGWDIALEGANLTDRSYRTTGYNQPVFGVLTGFYGAPRTWSVTLRRGF